MTDIIAAPSALLEAARAAGRALAAHRTSLEPLRAAAAQAARALDAAEVQAVEAAAAQAAGEPAEPPSRPAASIKTLAAALRAAEDALARAERVEGALVARCHAADAALADATPGLRDDVLAHQAALLAHLDAELLEAIAPLQAWIARAVGYGDAAGTPAVRVALARLAVPLLSSGGVLVDGVKAMQADLSMAEIRPAFEGVPAGVSAPARLLREVQSYRPLCVRDRAPALEVIAPGAGEMTRRAAEARNAARLQAAAEAAALT